MTEGPPLELLQDALARIGEDGALVAVTPAMASWLAGVAADNLAALPLEADQRDELQAGGPVGLLTSTGAFELQRLQHAGCSWLRVHDVGERQRAAAAHDAAARARSLAGLAGSIAHDLNNQLNAAIGLSSMLSPLARDELDRESLRALDKAVMHGARLADMTARLLHRAPDRRATSDAGQVLTDLLTMVKKSLDIAEVTLELDACASDLKLRALHDGAVHALLVGVMAVLEGHPASLRVGAVGERRAIAGGREREVVLVRLDASGLAADFGARLSRLVAVAPAALELGASRGAFAGVVGMVAMQRRIGGDVVAMQQHLGGDVVAMQRRLGGDVVAMQRRLGGDVVAMQRRLDGDVVAMQRRLDGDVVAMQRPIGGDVVANMEDGVLRLEWLWPRVRS